MGRAVWGSRQGGAKPSGTVTLLSVVLSRQCPSPDHGLTSYIALLHYNTYSLHSAAAL